MPDYTAGISKTFKAISTAETNGFFEVIGTAFWNNHLVVRINGLERTLATSTNNTYSTVGYNLFPVRKGDTIEGVSSYNNTGSINFYPCKG